MKLYSTEDEICSQKEYYDRCLFQANLKTTKYIYRSRNIIVYYYILKTGWKYEKKKFQNGK